MFQNIELHSPYFLLLFLVFIPLLILDSKRKKRSGILVPSSKSMKASGSIGWILKFLKITKYLILTGLILAMARPRTFSISQDNDDNKGVDIMLAVDVSLSMLSKDLDPDRLTALKDIAQKFIKKRPTDRLGLVEYSGEAFMKVPLTSDHQVILDEISIMQPGELQPGTSIGDGLTVAVNHIKHSKAKSKIIILMTDGVNTIENAMAPQIAAELAKNNKIKVYTIGIGTNGYALFPSMTDIFGEIVFTEQEVKIDEPTLKLIADITGGRYFRATSNESLENIYNEINLLEKTDIKQNKVYNYQEYFRYFLWFSFIVLFLDALLRWKIFKIIN